MSLTVTSQGVTTELIGGATFWLEAEDGVGSVPLHRLAERGPQQHGASDLGYRLDPRIVLLTLGVGGVDIAETYAARRTLVRIFHRNAGKLVLTWTLPDGAVRALDCKVQRAPVFPSVDRQGFWDRTVVELIAHEPTFYDPAAKQYRFGIAAGTSRLTVPIKVPMKVGSSTVNATRLIEELGDAPSFPLIRIAGPITNPKITNNVTYGDGRTEAWSLDFTGTTIGSAAFFDIDTRYGAKTVIDQAGVNRISTLVESTSDLASFQLIGDPGQNSVTVTGTAASVSTEVLFTYYARYDGI